MVRVYDVPGSGAAEVNTSRSTYLVRLQEAQSRFDDLVSSKLKGVHMDDIMQILEFRAQVEEAPEPKRLEVIESSIVKIRAMKVLVGK